MNRRRFLATLLGGAAALAVDQAIPEVARRYFLPPAGGWAKDTVTILGRGPLTITLPAPPPGLAFHPDAFRGMFNPSADVQRAYNQARSLEAEGISLRFIRQYDINTDQWPTRLDLIYGVGTLMPQLACRILSDDEAPHEGARARRRRKRQEAFALPHSGHQPEVDSTAADRLVTISGDDTPGLRQRPVHAFGDLPAVLRSRGAGLPLLLRL